MVKKTTLYTAEGFQALKDELLELTTVTREKIKNDIAVAKSFGDLSENSEYDAALNAQAETEARIKELNELIENGKVVNDNEIDTSTISLGSQVRVMDYDLDEEVEYSIVGSNQANPLSGMISDQSPIGKALMGAREGDEVEADVPAGIIKMRVLSVSRTNK